MTMTVQINQNLDVYLTPEAEAEGEWVAGVTREKLEKSFPNLPFSGLLEIDEDELVTFLQGNLQYRARSEQLERDEAFEQLITYFLIRNKKGDFFMSQRKAKGGEARAHGAYLIGFGGHLRKEDTKGKMTEWLQREFEEEVRVENLKGIKFLGLFNNDSEEMQKVNRVHFGIVFEMTVDGSVELAEEEKFEKGRFVPLTEVLDNKDRLETWSRVIAESLWVHGLDK